MYVTVIHTIQDPDRFWAAAESQPPPEGVVLHSVLPNGDGTRAVCLWEADSREPVEKAVEDTVGDASSNEYYEVNASNAQGLPSQTAA
jgi:hypothetical protein